MKSIRLCLAALALSLFSTAANACLVGGVPYDDLFAKADLIVIAHPITKTRDAGEKTYFDGVTQADEKGTHQVVAIGVETQFEVAALIKGTGIRQFTLHHYREQEDLASQGPSVGCSLGLVSFKPTNGFPGDFFLLFLTKEKDGRYAPYGGQISLANHGVISAISDPYR